MLNVHLYFVKIFGCLIAENGLPINIEEFSRAILNVAAHPRVHLAISALVYDLPCASVGYSNLSLAKLDGRTVYAIWFLTLDKFAVRIIYAEPNERRRGLCDAWHPSTIAKQLRISRL